MAAATGATSGITYTSSGSGVFTEDFSIDLAVGKYNDDTAWLDGGAAAGSYPGALDGFAAKNTNTTNPNILSTKPHRLVMGRFSTVLVNDETITVSGVGTTAIHAVIVGDTSTAASSLFLKAAPAGAVATFTVTGTQVAGVTCWMLVS